MRTETYHCDVCRDEKDFNELMALTNAWAHTKGRDLRHKEFYLDICEKCFYEKFPNEKTHS